MFKVFWMVWGAGAPAPTVMHDTIDSAKAEAERLARIHAPQPFYVMVAEGRALKTDVSWERASFGDDENPF